MLRKPAHAYVLVTGILACMCLLHPPATGMDPDRAMSQYVHDRWGAEQGFPPGPVYAITQAADGYLWIGAEAGLVRFDGWNFRVIKDDTGAFTIGSVLGLTSDDEGCLWLRLQDLSLVRYCRGVFERPSAQHRGVEAMNRASTGGIRVWAGREGSFRFPGGPPELLL